MYIEVECKACQKTYKAPESLAGKYVKCKGCGAPLLVRDPSLADLDDTAAGQKLAFDVKEDDAPERGTVADTRPPLIPEIVTEMLLPLLLIVGGVGWAGYLSVMACLHSNNPVIAFIFLGLAVGLLLLMVTPLTIRAIESSSKSLDYDLPNAVWLQAFSMLVVPTAAMTIGWFQSENHWVGLGTGLVIGILVMGVLLGLFYRITPVQAAITTIFSALVYLCTSGVVVGICAVLAVILSMSHNQLPWQPKEVASSDTSVRASGPIASVTTRPVVASPTSAPAPIVVAPAPAPIVVAPKVEPTVLEPQWVACVDPAAQVAKWPNEVQRPIEVKPPVTIAHSYVDSPFVALMDRDSVDVYDLRTNKRVGFMKQPMKPTSASLSSTGAYLAAVFGYGAGGQTPSIQVWEVAAARPLMQIRPDAGMPLPTLVGWAGEDKIVTTGVRGGAPLVQLWDVKKGVPVHEMNVQGSLMPNASAVSPGGRYFAYTWGGKVHVYDLTSGDSMGKSDFVPVTVAVKALKFSPDGAEIAALATDMITPHVAVLDLTSGKKTTDVAVQGGSHLELAPERFHWSPGCFAFLVDNDWVDRTSGRVMSTLQPLTLPTATGKPCMLINDYTALMEATPIANGERVIYKSVNLPKSEIESALKTVNGSVPAARTGVVASAAPTTSSGGTEDVAIADPGGTRIGSPTTTPNSAPAPKMATVSMAGQKEWVVTVIAVNKTDEAAIEQQITAAQDRLKQIEKELVTARTAQTQMNRMNTSVDAYGRSRSVPMYPEAERAKANMAVTHLEDERRELKGTAARLEKSKDAAKNTRTITARDDEGVAFEITAEGSAMITIAETMQPDSKWKIGGFGRVVEGVLNVKLQKATPAQ